MYIAVAPRQSSEKAVHLFVSNRELALLKRSHLPDALQPVVTFAYLTGWRQKSEILPLEWRQVDFVGRVVRLDPGTTKNKEGRMYPFTADLEKVLKEQQTVHDKLKKEGRIVPLVFHRDGSRIKNIRKA